MRKFIVLVFFVLLSVATKGQEEPFMFGMMWAYEDLLDTCKYLGATHIIEGIRNNNYSSYVDSDFKVIPTQSYLDSVTVWYHAYTGGHINRWEFENMIDTSDVEPGYLCQAGNVTTEDGYDCWTTASLDPNFACDSILSGPFYQQAKKYYKVVQPAQWGNIVKYKINLRYKLEWDGGQARLEPPHIEDSTNVMKLNFLYRYYDKDTHEIIEKTLGSPVYITDEELDNGWQETDFNGYMYDLGNVPVDMAPTDNILMVKGNDRFRDNLQYEGFRVNFDWLYEHPSFNDVKYVIYLDYFEIECQYLGVDLLEYPMDAKARITSSIEAFNFGLTEIPYYYGMFEPTYIDFFLAIRKTRDYMNELTSSKKAEILITYNPIWETANGIDRYEKMDMYLDIVEPDPLMFNRYPIVGSQAQWQNNITHAHNKIATYKERLNASGVYENGFISKIQTHEWQAGDILFPEPFQLEGMINLSLAFGAKGLFFFNLRGAERGILDTNGVPTSLYYAIKNKFAPRMNNMINYNITGPTEFSKLLTELNYTGNFSDYKTNMAHPEHISIIMPGEWISFEQSGTNLPSIFTVTELEKPGLSFVKYRYIINSFLSDSNHTGYNVMKLGNPFSGYHNIHVKDIESGMNICYEDSISLPAGLTAGQGRLIIFEPLAFSGGNSTEGNDTIRFPIALADTLTISDSTKFVIQNDYTLNADIFIEDGGELEIASGGNINLDGGNLYYSDWSESLLLMESGNHPKLVWGVYTWMDSVHYYKIYRKSHTGSWNYIEQTTLNYYVDETYTIYSGSGDSIMIQYRVTAFGEDGRLIESDYSNTESIWANTGEVGKISHTKEGIPEDYELYANYPNPFNPSTRISFDLPEDTNIKLELFDILGNRITILTDKKMKAGNHSVEFEPEGLASGVYICRITTEKFVKSIKMSYLK